MSPLKEHVPTALCCSRSRGAHETRYTFPGYAPAGLPRRSTPSLRGYLMHGHTLITPLYTDSHPSIQSIPGIPTSVGVRKVFLERPRPAHQLACDRPTDLPVRPSLSPSTRRLLSLLLTIHIDPHPSLLSHPSRPPAFFPPSLPPPLFPLLLLLPPSSPSPLSFFSLPLSSLIPLPPAVKL